MYEAKVTFMNLGKPKSEFESTGAADYPLTAEEYWKPVVELTQANWNTLKAGECGYVLEDGQKQPYFAKVDMRKLSGDFVDFIPYDGSDYWERYGQWSTNS